MFFIYLIEVLKDPSSPETKSESLMKDIVDSGIWLSYRPARVDSGIGLSYRPARLHRLAGRYDRVDDIPPVRD